MNPRTFLALVGTSTLLTLGACHDGSSGSSTPQTTNTGLALADLRGDGDLWLLSVPESAQGGADLNGDGDALDQVVSVLDLATGSVTPTSLDVTQQPFAPFWGVGGALAALGVSEEGQGGLDLNGDGDATDWVLHIFEAGSGTVENLGISVAPASVALFVDDGGVGFVVDEVSEGRGDLNGDGDTNDTVLHHWDALAREVVKITAHMRFHQYDAGFAAVLISETFEGLDLNGDGDANDLDVVHLYDTRTRQLENLGLATTSIGLAFGAGWLVIPVLEGANGGLDRNGDGDALDKLYVLHEPATGASWETGLSGPPVGAFHHPAPSTDARVVVITGETAGFDRNGDGDLDDLWPVILTPATADVFDPSLTFDVFFSTLTLAGDRMAIEVDEARQGLDLNDDLDLEDQVVHELDLAQRTYSNLRLVVADVTATPARLLLPRFESWDFTDWNGDGDQDDLVPALFEGDSGALTNTRLSTTGQSVSLTDDRLLFVGREPRGGSFEFEFLVHDAKRRASQPLGLLGGFSLRLAASGTGTALFTVNEGFQQRDLNGDGDLDDDVLHLVQ
jgi:hypothetical protein